MPMPWPIMGGRLLAAQAVSPGLPPRLDHQDYHPEDTSSLPQAWDLEEQVCPRLVQAYPWEEGQYASFVFSSLWSLEHDKLISASAQVLNLYKLYHIKLFTPQNRLMPYQAYPFHWPLVHWPQRAYDPRVVADGFKCKTSGNFPSESCDRWRQTGQSQEPWNPIHGIFLQLLHLCRGSIRVKGEKIEVNKMKNHDGSPTLTLIYAFSSNVLMGFA